MAKHHRASGQHRIVCRRNKGWSNNGCFTGDCSGEAFVEATILFPIMIMIFAALVLLAVYLPAQAALQHATQYAANAIATENSDTWLVFDENSMDYEWLTHKSELPNVYANLFSGSGDVQSKAEDIVALIEGRQLSSKSGELTVRGEPLNYIIYKEIVVTAEREIPMPINLSFIGFPETIKITVTSRAVVQDGDEFIRNIDLAGDFVGFISEKFGLDDVAESIGGFGERVKSFLGW